MRLLGFKFMLVVVCLVVLLSTYTVMARQNPDQLETGFAVKKPVIGASTPVAAWGAIAVIFRKAMQPYGWDVQVCYNCAGGPEAARYVFQKRMPRPLPPNLAGELGPSPRGPVDLGVTTPNFLWWAYQGKNHFAADGPQRNLRLIALIQNPMYLFVAVKSELGITDLSQVRGKPVRILWDEGENAITHAGLEILKHYGMSQASIEAAGGAFVPRQNRATRGNFDILMMVGAVSNTPNCDVLLEVSQKYDLHFLQLPDDPLNKIANDFDMERGEMPAGILRGVDRVVSTVTYNGNVVYSRTDMPDSFAYTAAQALDEHRNLFLWALENYSYDPRTVWKAYGVPLHPGAERYYRERGYMK